MTTTRTPEQQRIAEELSRKYEIDKDRIYFVGPTEPWLPADVLTVLARKSDDVIALVESFDQFISELKQVVHQATVTTKDGRSFTRCGIATIGEKLPSGEEADEHGLAASRAIGAALTAAGVNPLRASSAPSQSSAISTAAEPDLRVSQGRQIHTLAEKLSLIRDGEGGEKDRTRYEDFLMESWGVESIVGMDTTMRASVINKLRIMEQGMAA